MPAQATLRYSQNRWKSSRINHANYNGGAACLDRVYDFDSMPQLYSWNSTIVDNEAGFGAWIPGNVGGVVAIGLPWSMNFLANNSIIADNFTYTATGTSPLDVDVGTFGVHNFIGAAEGNIEVVDGVDGNQIGTIANPIDPRLYSLQLNNGQTRCRKPVPTSPVVDAGENSAPGAAANSDQRGSTRFNGTIDIGSVER